MSRRFFCQSPLTDCEIVHLEGAEAHHLIHVMRAKVHDQVVLFDGTGQEYQATIERLQRKRVTLHIDSRCAVSRELPFSLTLAVALPRGDRQDWLVQKAVELGVTRLVPWQTERSVARPNTNTLQRLRRAVIEASKQCGRNRLMDVEAPCRFDDFLARPATGPALLAHLAENTAAPSSVADVLPRHRHTDLRIGVGPEGGFTEAEVDRAGAAGWRTVDLGARTLRTETAALALSAQLAIIVPMYDFAEPTNDEAGVGAAEKPSDDASQRT